MGIDELIVGKRDDILRVAARHGARKVRVFGSAAGERPTRPVTSTSSWNWSRAGRSSIWAVC